MERTGRYEVPDDSPAHQIASQWGYLRAEARTAPWPAQVELIEAAYARPELREVYAFTSMWALRFTTVVPPRRPVVTPGEVSLNTICIHGSHEGGFAVKAHWMDGPTLAEAAAAQEAVSIALRLAASGSDRHSTS